LKGDRAGVRVVQLTERPALTDRLLVVLELPLQQLDRVDPLVLVLLVGPLHGPLEDQLTPVGTTVLHDEAGALAPGQPLLQDHLAHRNLLPCFVLIRFLRMWRSTPLMPERYSSCFRSILSRWASRAATARRALSTLGSCFCLNAMM